MDRGTGWPNPQRFISQRANTRGAGQAAREVWALAPKAELAPVVFWVSNALALQFLLGGAALSAKGPSLNKLRSKRPKQHFSYASERPSEVVLPTGAYQDLQEQHNTAQHSTFVILI